MSENVAGPRRSDVSGPPRISPALVAVAAGLLVVDLLLLAGNLMFLTADEPREQSHPVFSDLRFNGDNDRSFPEMFGYLLMVVNAAFLTVLWRRRGAVFGVLGLIVLAILADDFLMLHERVGVWFTSVSADIEVAGLGPQHVGELVFWAGAALVLGALLLATYLRSSRADRRSGRIVMGLLVALVFFAVGVDLLHSALIPYVSSFTITAVTLVETFGELGAMSVLVLVLVSMVGRDRREAASRPDSERQVASAV